MNIELTNLLGFLSWMVFLEVTNATLHLWVSQTKIVINFERSWLITIETNNDYFEV